MPNTVLNKEVSAIINEYIKGGESKVDASIKLATLCNDEITCLEAARMLYDAGDFYSAKRWLQMGNVANTNELFVAIENRLSDSKKSLKLPDVLQVIDIKGNSLLAESSLSSSILMKPSKTSTGLIGAFSISDNFVKSFSLDSTALISYLLIFSIS